MSSIDLSDSTTVVTGAGSGIGAAIALLAAERGSRVAIVDVDADGAESTADTIRAAGGEAVAVTADVGSPDDVTRVRHEVTNALGPARILVNNAGILRDAQLTKMPRENWDAVLRINLAGSTMMCSCFAEDLSASGRGRIVNIASRSLLGNFGQTNYAASKAAVVALTKSLAIELGPGGTTVNAIAPGYIETPIMQNVPAELRDKAIRAAPLRRVGAPEDVAEAALFLVSGLASYITGQCLFICGGRSLLGALEIW